MRFNKFDRYMGQGMKTETKMTNDEKERVLNRLLGFMDQLEIEAKTNVTHMEVHRRKRGNNGQHTKK